MQEIQITPVLHIELSQLDDNGRAVLALVQRQPRKNPARVWMRLDEVKAVVAASTNRTVRLLDGELDG